VRSLLHLLRWRAANEALFNGTFRVGPSQDDRLVLSWATADGRSAEARIDLTARRYEVEVDGEVVTSVDHLALA
jgi:hypothetical protein